MRVNELAKLAEVSADTVRYYTRIGFLNPLKSPSNGYKNYGDKDRQRLHFIINARRLGFSVKEIGQIFQQADRGKTVCPMVRNLIEHHLQETEKQFRQTQALRKRLQTALKDWQNKPDRAPTGNMICHLVEGIGE